MINIVIPKSESVLTIFEGPDGSGKTTIAQLLAKKTGAEYHHFVEPIDGEDVIGKFYEIMYDTIKHGKKTVFDRCWISDPIYANIHRGEKPRIPYRYVQSLEYMALAANGIVIVCNPGWNSVLNSFNSRRAEELLDSEKKLESVFRAYGRVQTKLPKYSFNYRLQTISVDREIRRNSKIMVG